jgi:hypothetical protein
VFFTRTAFVHLEGVSSEHVNILSAARCLAQSTNKAAFAASPFAEKNNARTLSRKAAKGNDFPASLRLWVFALETGGFCVLVKNT